MRRFAMIALVLAACGGSPAPAPPAPAPPPSASTAPASSSAAPIEAGAPTAQDPSVDDRYTCKDDRCSVHVITPRVQAALEAMPKRNELQIAFVEDADDAALRSVERIPWVTALVVDSRTITDLAPLASLKELRHLAISNGRLSAGGSIASIAAIKNATQLEQLAIAGLSKVTDFSVVGTFTHLKRLTLAKNELTSIAFVTGLAELGSLELNFEHKLKDLAPLASLKSLELLRLQDVAPGASLKPLQGLANLRELTVAFNEFADLSTVRSLTHLRSLGVSSIASFKDVALVASLPDLESVSIQQTAVSTVAPLAKLTKLKELVIFQTPVRDVTPLAGVKTLKTLMVSSTVPPEQIATLKKANPLLMVSVQSR